MCHGLFMGRCPHPNHLPLRQTRSALNKPEDKIPFSPCELETPKVEDFQLNQGNNQQSPHLKTESGQAGFDSAPVLWVNKCVFSRAVSLAPLTSLKLIFFKKKKALIKIWQPFEAVSLTLSVKHITQRPVLCLNTKVCKHTGLFFWLQSLNFSNSI